MEVSVAVGTREIEDKVWGIFLPDNQTELIWDLMQTTLREHGLRTDIAYVDPEFELSPQYVNVYSATNGST